MRLILEFLELIAVLVLVVPGLIFAFRVYARERRPDWSAVLERRRLSLLLIALLVVIAFNVGEDALDGESAAIDVLTLLALRDHLSPTAVGFFDLITLTGSSMFLAPLTFAATLVLLWMRHRFEAFLLAASVIGGALTVYVVKALASRDRPALWDHRAYWGSSFPSGHTLAVAAFAIAAVLCTIRMRPALKGLALTIALPWIFLVGVSRLVLGVHWPTDVLVAACIGAAIPLTISVLHELRYGGPVRTPDDNAGPRP